MTLENVLDTIAAVCMITGALLSLAAGVALLRFPDLMSRMHAATKPQVLGLLLMLTGCAIRIGALVDITTMVLIAIFQLATAPVAAHMVGRAVYRDGHTRKDLLIVDELAPDADKFTEVSPDQSRQTPGAPR
ncbi:monovalent cation/H(+) antiporter subunit G [Glycomyces sp. NRRL B-16210]|uniref:monovalent cation/H(+) antiporter subunit G n=1 Tax=Glycomyces sp. NRRL B-16210 TaxID=1463821 RepID=UPI0004BFA0B5|nr:monovalent cation/H(+) antiporter subunit G [Glycomyces sp. NRRL B-16210]